MLDGRTGWRTGENVSVSVSDSDGLRLDARAGGSLSLTSEDGSLGGIVLPLGMASDEAGALYLLGQKRAGVRRFDPERGEFVPLAAVGAEFGGEVRQFYEQFRDASNPLPSSIAVAGFNLYVADRGNRRVQVFALQTLAVRHVWGARDADGRPTRVDDPDAWEPVDVATHGGRAYILDRRYNRVYVHRPGSDALRLFIQGHGVGNRWTRLAVDREGRIYLFNLESPRVEIYDAHGQLSETKTDAGDIRDRFDPPSVRLHRSDASEPWRFCLPENLLRQCAELESARAQIAAESETCAHDDKDAQACDCCASTKTKATGAPAQGCASQSQSQAQTQSQLQPQSKSQSPTCSSLSPAELIFDRAGERVRVRFEQHTGAQIYTTGGEWQSERLDSEIYRCQWHRIELELGELPPGTRLEIYTYTDAEKLSPEDVRARPQKLWSKAYAVSGRLAPPLPKKTDGKRATQSAECAAQSRQGVGAHEFLVQSGEGQYLWLKIVFSGDGYGTPAVTSLRVRYPRESYLAYLPAVYSSDEESRSFLERFLSIFQTEWDEIERRIEDFPAYFDAQAVPEGAFLEYLASWFALPLEGSWNGEQKRRLLEAVSGIYFGRWKVTGAGDECLTEIDPEHAARRGTREGLRRYLQVYLQNMTGLSPAEQGGYPHIVEGFRERERLMLATNNLATLAHGAPLWSPAEVGRLQLDEFAREGEARLVSTGDPEHDIFQEFAHRFRVFVPSSWVRDGRDEEMLRRALNAEKPAHTSFDLCLVEPRFRVGLQSTIGIDTILGARPVARLACTHAEAGDAPSRSPHARLGFDTILAARAVAGDQPTMQLGTRARAGLDTILN